MNRECEPKGNLIIIGGHEKRLDGNRTILEEVAQRANRGGKEGGKLVVVTVASSEPEELADTYLQAFHELGVKRVEVLDIRDRAEAHQPEKVQRLDGARVVFFTGGDQLRITSQIGDSPIYRCLLELFEKKGITIAGTSAGAAAMSDTMLISGPGDESNRLSALGMAPGLGLARDMVIDSHFAQRGRIGRLLGAVAQNPRNLGVGIDEDTAIIVDPLRSFRVLGNGAVYVADGKDVTYSNLSDKDPGDILSLYDVRLHVLGTGYSFDLQNRRPYQEEAAGKEPPQKSEK